MTTEAGQTIPEVEEKDDAFDLSPDGFRKAKQDLLDGNEPADTGTPPAETKKPDDTKPPEDKPKEPDLTGFTLETKPPEGEEATEEIVHNGQPKKLTKSELKALAQKGFDYDYKVQQLTPHRNLTNAITHDQQLAGIVSDYLNSGGKSWRLPPTAASNQQPPGNQLPDGFKVKSLRDFSADDPDAADKWLQDNVSALATAIRADMAKPTLQTQGNVVNMPDRQRDNTARMAQLAQSVLFHRDTENFQKVYPEMLKMIPKLTQEQAQALEAQAATGNMIGLTKLYDHVKQFVIPASPAIPQHGKPTFRMKPDGGKPSGQTVQPSEEDPNYVWNLPGKDFQAEIRKAKGY